MKKLTKTLFLPLSLLVLGVSSCANEEAASEETSSLESLETSEETSSSLEGTSSLERTSSAISSLEQSSSSETSSSSEEASSSLSSSETSSSLEITSEAPKTAIEKILEASKTDPLSVRTEALYSNDSIYEGFTLTAAGYVAFTYSDGEVSAAYSYSKQDINEDEFGESLIVTTTGDEAPVSGPNFTSAVYKVNFQNKLERNIVLRNFAYSFLSEEEISVTGDAVYSFSVAKSEVSIFLNSYSFSNINSMDVKLTTSNAKLSSLNIAYSTDSGASISYISTFSY